MSITAFEPWSRCLGAALLCILFAGSISAQVPIASQSASQSLPAEMASVARPDEDTGR